MKKTIMLVLCAFFILAFSAHAARTGIIGSILNPIGDIASVYDRFDVFIDAAIYLVIFLGLAQLTLGKKYRFEDGKGGKAVQIGIALVLSISLALFEASAGFNIKSFGPVAGIILVSMLGFVIFALMTNFGADKKTALAASYALIYFTIQATTPNIIQWIDKNADIVGALLALAAFVALIYLIYHMIMALVRTFSSGKSDKPLNPEEVARRQLEELKRNQQHPEKTEESREEEQREAARQVEEQEQREAIVPIDTSRLRAVWDLLRQAQAELKEIPDKEMNEFVALVEKIVNDWNIVNKNNENEKAAGLEKLKGNTQDARNKAQEMVESWEKCDTKILQAFALIKNLFELDEYSKSKKKIKWIMRLIRNVKRNRNYKDAKTQIESCKRILENYIDAGIENLRDGSGGLPGLMKSNIFNASSAGTRKTRPEQINDSIKDAISNIYIPIHEIKELLRKIERNNSRLRT